MLESWIAWRHRMGNDCLRRLPDGFPNDFLIWPGARDRGVKSYSATFDDDWIRWGFEYPPFESARNVNEDVAESVVVIHFKTVERQGTTPLLCHNWVRGPAADQRCLSPNNSISCRGVSRSRSTVLAVRINGAARCGKQCCRRERERGEREKRGYRFHAIRWQFSEATNEDA